MLRELKNHNPKYAERLIEYCRSLDLESICIEHSEKFVDFVIERMEKQK